jgi:hypothetical protein
MSRVIIIHKASKPTPDPLPLRNEGVWSLKLPLSPHYRIHFMTYTHRQREKVIKMTLVYMLAACDPPPMWTGTGRPIFTSSVSLPIAFRLISYVNE